MGEEITKSELLIFTEAHAKAAMALEKITDRLSDIISKQDKMLDKQDKILEQTEKYVPETIVKQLTDNLDNCDMAQDVKHTKWFVGIVAVVIIVCTVLFNGMSRKDALAQAIKDTIKPEALISP